MSPKSPARRVVYGTLAPGRPNHRLLEGLSGRGIDGTVRRELHQLGWGAALGYPGLVLDPADPTVVVQVFESPELRAHWSRLDEFEGPDIGVRSRS